MKYFSLIFIGIVIFSACRVGPKYNRPAVQSFPSYTGLDSTAKADSIQLIAWTEVYKDPALVSLIQLSLSNNLDLLSAVSRVDEARAIYGFSRSALYPSIGYDINAGVNNLGANAQQTGIGIDNERYYGLATMNWEIDLFGKLRHQKRSAYAEFLASDNNAKALRVSLIAETATLYFILRDLDNRLEIANATVKSRLESLKIISERFNKGYVAELDQLQAQQQLAQVQAAVPNLERQIVNIQNALRVLTGQVPGSILRGLNNYNQQFPPEIPAGIPSDLLQRRPDIIAAEQYFVSQSEQIGVAVATRFPSLSLTGFLGYASPQLSTIVDPASLAIGVSGGILGPLFEFGKNRRRVEVQRERTEQLSYQYQKIVLAAFAEVDNSLTGVRTYKTEYEANLAELTAASKAFTLTEARYDNGYSDYLELLIQQDNLFDAQVKESATKSQQNIAVVNLFKALGGGWDAR